MSEDQDRRRIVSLMDSREIGDKPNLEPPLRLPPQPPPLFCERQLPLRLLGKGGRLKPHPESKLP